MIDLKTIVRLCGRAITKDIWKSDSKCTNNFRTTFSKFAEELGYRPQYAKHPKEFFGIDMVWWDDWRLLAAIEHENVPKTNPIENEWMKLTYIDADYRILISYCTPEDRRRKWLKRASEIVAGNPRGKAVGYYLVLGDETFWGFRGYEFDNSGLQLAEIKVP